MEFLATPHLWEIYEAPARTPGQTAFSPWLISRAHYKTAAVGGAIAVIGMSSQLQAKIFPDGGTAYVATPPGYNLNIRSGPGTRFPAVNTVQRGTPLNITGYYENGWAQLSDRSWTAGNLISSDPVSGNYYGSAAIAYIAPPTGYNVNIRSGPGVNYPAVNTLARGTAITITGRYENGWAQLVDGSWVASNLIYISESVQVPQPQPQPPPTDADYLRLGTRSPAVIPLENRLRTLNYFTSNFIADDYYGTDTEQAIKNFQRLNQLPVDGVAGPQTRNVLYSNAAVPLNSNPGIPTQPAEEFRLGTSDPDVEPLEIRLRDLGYLPEGFTADTYYGQDTEAAVRQFQQRNALTVTGVADARTRAVIYSDTAVPAYQPPTNPPVDPTDPPNPNPPDGGSSRQVRVSTNDGQDALAFSGPGTEYDLTGFIPNGQIVTITGRTQDNWSELQDGNWIYTDFLDLQSST